MNERRHGSLHWAQHVQSVWTSHEHNCDFQAKSFWLTRPCMVQRALEPAILGALPLRSVSTWQSRCRYGVSCPKTLGFCISKNLLQALGFCSMHKPGVAA